MTSSAGSLICLVQRSSLKALNISQILEIIDMVPKDWVSGCYADNLVQKVQLGMRGKILRVSMMSKSIWLPLFNSHLLLSNCTTVLKRRQWWHCTDSEICCKLSRKKSHGLSIRLVSHTMWMHLLQNIPSYNLCQLIALQPVLTTPFCCQGQRKEIRAEKKMCLKASQPSSPTGFLTAPRSSELLWPASQSMIQWQITYRRFSFSKIEGPAKTKEQALRILV